LNSTFDKYQATAYKPHVYFPYRKNERTQPDSPETNDRGYLKYLRKNAWQVKLAGMAFSQWRMSSGLLSSPTIVLIIANVLVYVLLLTGGDPMYYLLAQVGELFFQQHYYWQLFTSMFVHFGILHILFNIYGLYYFGRLNEAHFSIPQYLAIYFGSGLLGNVVSLYLIPLNVPSGGASGAIFGLVGSYVTIEKKAQHMGMALFYAALIFIQSSGPGVNIFAHLFGLIGGLVLGLAFSSRRQPGGYTMGYTFST
jgi:rhomboid protease GluP